MRNKVNVLLLGAGGNAGISYTRCLKMADQNLNIIGCDIDKYNLHVAETDKSYLLPFDEDEKKVSILLDIIKNERIDFIHAQPDLEVKFLLKYKAEFDSLVFRHNLNIWNIFSNKLRSQEIWKDKLKLKFEVVSLSKVIKNKSLFDKLQRNQNKVWIRAITGAGSKAALPVTSYDQAIHWANYWHDTKNLKTQDFMLSEFLPGREYAVQTLWINGELIHSQSRERVTYFFAAAMPSGQSSTASVAKITNNKNVYKVAYNAIKAIDECPHGIYCVDLKENAKGEPNPMEVNYGRYFTTSDFFATLGMNSPYVQLKYFLTKSTKELDKKIEGIEKEWIWLRGIDRQPKLYSEDDNTIINHNK
eukprot:COSAG01_NODE_755_length_13819_cov_130.671939_3_plen_360_part_00